MSYLVFARKFRPQNFEEVVGQEAIVTTLGNAIRQERIPQNFLFSGPRGIGKTSTARILAKALNCAKGPTDKPCGKCPSCIEITQTNSLDVLEIDGASNRGIDEIRNLRETVKFKPVTGRFKIYIIDEVHMLTTEAFNALLKTLEEPPPHVKFVFATTEPHKVPLTILSRCQRFNFKRIPIGEIETKLEEIAKSEKLKFEKNALFQIAKASDGSLRDAEGLLDQMATFSEDKIKEEDVLLALGLASEEIYFSILTALKAKNANKIFSMIGELYDSGKDLVQFAKGLLEIFRHLLLFQCAEKAEEYVDLSAEGIAELKKRVKDFSRGELLLAMSLLNNLQNHLRRNLAPPRLLVETTLLKLLHLDGLKLVEDLMQASGAEPRSAAPVTNPSRPAEIPRAVAPSPSMSRKPQAQSAEFPAAGSGSAPSAVMTANTMMSIDDVEVIWPRVIDEIKTKRMSTGIFLSESSPVEVSDGTVTLGLPSEFQFHKEMLEKESNRKLIEESFEMISGKKVRILFVITQSDRREGAKQSSAAGEDPMPEIITQAMNIFDGAKIIRKE